MSLAIMKDLLAADAMFLQSAVRVPLSKVEIVVMVKLGVEEGAVTGFTIRGNRLFSRSSVLTEVGKAFKYLQDNSRVFLCQSRQRGSYLMFPERASLIPVGQSDLGISHPLKNS